MQLLSAGLVVSMIGTVTEAYQDAMEADDFPAEIGTFISIVLVATAAFYLLIAVGLVVLAIFNNRGKNGARITTWVIAGLGLCCNSLGLGSSVADTAVGGNVPSTEQAQIEADVAAAMPGWYDAISLVTSVITVLALLGAVILLALPQSNAFFRRPVAWNPAMPFGPYPSLPGQPGFPVQPGYPHQAGYQPQPGFYPQPTYPPAQPPVFPVQPTYPGAPTYPPPPPSHFGSPEQYGRPGEPAPGLPPYPGQPGSVPPQGLEPSSDPWAPPPSPPPLSSAPPASSPSSAPPAPEQPPADGGTPEDEPPQRPAG
ncbi:hypothetical protein [Actinoplanes lobatus]|nr:hypothetical protein [Actinoplanes lobatus]MBB4748005.1 hypothetical protein [Actinoplanes lobatus]